MRNLKIMLVVALGAVLFSSCSTGSGCYYGSIDLQEINTDANAKVILNTPAPQKSYTTEIAR